MTDLVNTNSELILKDYYFPVTIRNFHKTIFVTINDSVHNGIPDNALVLKIWARGTTDYNVCCCVHSPSGWKKYSAKDDCERSKKMRRTRETYEKKKEDTKEVTFEMMVRLYSPNGTAYSGFKRPTFDIHFDLWHKTDQGGVMVATCTKKVEAVTKIPKRPITIKLEEVTIPQSPKSEMPSPIIDPMGHAGGNVDSHSLIFQGFDGSSPQEWTDEDSIVLSSSPIAEDNLMEYRMNLPIVNHVNFSTSSSSTQQQMHSQPQPYTQLNNPGEQNVLGSFDPLYYDEPTSDLM